MSCYIYVCKYVRASPAVARSVYDPTKNIFHIQEIGYLLFCNPHLRKWNRDSK
jgi:hypothetical protein